MLLIGSHVSFDQKEQLIKSVREASSYGANTFMFYTGAPQNTRRANLDSALTKTAITEMEKKGIIFEQVIVHAPYIVNLANRKEEDKFSFSVNFLKQEIVRCHTLGCRYLVLHPGSHVGEGMDVGIQNIIDGLNLILEDDDSDVMILLETMAGKGTEVGSKLEELKKIIDGVLKTERIGVCLDTCHLNDAGYDLTKFDEFLKKFDSLIGLSRIHCVHVNDSKNVFGAKKDRHENIGFGTIGFSTLISIIYAKELENVPKILETPYVEGNPPYRQEIAMIKAKKFDENLQKDLQKISKK